MRIQYLFIMLAALLCMASRVSFAADDLPWKWDAQASQLSNCILDVPSFYGVTIDVGAEKHDITITVSDNKKHSVSWKGHEYSVFQINQDAGRVYYALFAPMDDGAEIKCVEIKTGNEIWHAELQGLSVGTHFKYTNRLNMAIKNDGNIIIYGNETFGKYIEVLDAGTGKQVSHKIVETAQK